MAHDMSKNNMPEPSTQLFRYPKYWAECFGVAPFLPMSRAEMETRIARFKDLKGFDGGLPPARRHSTGRIWIVSMVFSPASALVTTTIHSPGSTQPRRSR